MVIFQYSAGYSPRFQEPIVVFDTVLIEYAVGGRLNA